MVLLKYSTRWLERMIQVSAVEEADDDATITVNDPPVRALQQQALHTSPKGAAVMWNEPPHFAVLY